MNSLFECTSLDLLIVLYELRLTWLALVTNDDAREAICYSLAQNTQNILLTADVQLSLKTGLLSVKYE